MSDALAVTVFGDLRSAAPVAEQARQQVLALLEAGVRVEIVDPDDGVAHATEAAHLDIEALPRGRSSVIDLFYGPLNDLTRIPRSVRRPRGQTRYAVGAGWTWDRPVLAWEASFALHAVDEVWVSSSPLQSVFERETDVPVHLVPPVIQGPTTPEHGRAHFGLRDGTTVVLHELTAGASYELGNVFGAMQAYARAFPEANGNGDTELVLAIPDLERTPDLATEVRSRAAALGARVVDAPLTPAERSSLRGVADVRLSVHRGLSDASGLLDAMRQGTVVVGTAVGAHLAVADAANSRQVGYERSIITPFVHHFDKAQRRKHPVGEVWVEPDLDQAAFWLRDLHERPLERERLAGLAREAVTGRCSRAAVGAVLRERVEKIAAGLPR